MTLAGVVGCFWRELLVEGEVEHCLCGVDPAVAVAAPVLVLSQGILGIGEGWDLGQGDAASLTVTR